MRLSAAEAHASGIHSETSCCSQYMDKINSAVSTAGKQDKNSSLRRRPARRAAERAEIEATVPHLRRSVSPFKLSQRLRAGLTSIPFT